jgi:hypothetical protein
VCETFKLQGLAYSATKVGSLHSPSYGHPPENQRSALSRPAAFVDPQTRLRASLSVKLRCRMNSKHLFLLVVFVISLSTGLQPAAGDGEGSVLVVPISSEMNEVLEYLRDLP